MFKEQKMKRFNIKSPISFIIATGFAFSFLLIKNEKEGTPVDSKEFAPAGMVAYAASYSSDPSNEPQYSTQNSKTFQYLNLGHTLDYYRGDSVKVGIIDSGINYDHEDFMVNSSTKVKGDSKYYSYSGSSWVYYKASQHGYSYIDDTLGHGTNVAATVAAAVNSIGGTGLAPNVELYVYKVTNSSNGYEFGAIQNALSDAKTLGLDVINMSFQSYEHAVSYNGSSMGASTGCSTILSSYLNSAYNAGITLVGAAGNYNTDEPSYPGSNNHVINVGSLNQTGTDKAGFSNYGSTIDLVAPGYVYVADEASNSAYTNTQGTSFSAPLVTAAIALYKQKNPSATPAEIESALYASCDSIDDSGSEYTNWAGNGSLNVAKFLGVDVEDAPFEIVINNPEVVDEELELEVGDYLDLDWTVNGVGTFDDSVNFYTLSGEENVVSVNSSGRITATGVGEDYVVIESNADSNVYDSVYVTVTSSGGGTPTVSSVTVSPANLNLNLNGTKTGTLTTTVSGSNNPAQTVNWTSSNTSVATVSSGGLVTAKAVGNATITATSTVDNTKSGTCSITVTDSTVHVSGVTLNKNSTSIVAGGSETLTATVSPNNATNKSVNWSSNNTGVATVSNGTITAVAAGNATITVTTVDGNYSATCTVTVTAPQTKTLTITRSSFSTSGGYAWYDWTQATTDSTSISGKGELYTTTTTSMQFNKSKGNKVAAIYNSTALPGSITKIEATSQQTTIRSWTAYVTSTACSGSGTTLTFGSNKTTVGTASPAVGTSTSFGTSSAGYSYFCIQENDSSASYISEFKITYVPKSISSIAVKTAPTKTSYEAGECFNPTGLVITATYSDNSSKDISYASESESFSFSPSTSTVLTTSDTSVTITYSGKTCSQAITVSAAKVLSSISISGYTTSFVEGDTFAFGGTVTANYTDSTSANVTASATFSGYNMTTLGNQTVTISYTQGGVTKTTTYGITIGMGTLSSISVTGMTTNYIKNNAFSFDGTCTATFANGYQKSVTPTSVTSPDMSVAGDKTITVSFTYNGNTRTTSYNITVASNRTVIETTTTTVNSTITWPSSATPSISGSISGVSASLSGKTAYESSSIRLGTGSGGGTLSISAGAGITKLDISAKYYSNSYSAAVLKVDGQSVSNLGSDYSIYTVTLASAKTSFTILTENSSSRINIQSIKLYSTTTTETDISTSSDCVGLETFIDTYLHMNYVDNLGYCKDNEHHYYTTAKSAFNSLNEHQRTLFTSNSAYTSEWARLQAWANANGDSLNSSTLLDEKKNPLVLFNLSNNQGATGTIIVIVMSFLTCTLCASYVINKKRKNK